MMPLSLGVWVLANSWVNGAEGFEADAMCNSIPFASEGTAHEMSMDVRLEPTTADNPVGTPGASSGSGVGVGVGVEVGVGVGVGAGAAGHNPPAHTDQADTVLPGPVDLTLHR